MIPRRLNKVIKYHFLALVSIFIELSKQKKPEMNNLWLSMLF